MAVELHRETSERVNLCKSINFLSTANVGFSSIDRHLKLNFI